MESEQCETETPKSKILLQEISKQQQELRISLRDVLVQSEAKEAVEEEPCQRQSSIIEHLTGIVQSNKELLRAIDL